MKKILSLLALLLLGLASGESQAQGVTRVYATCGTSTWSVLDVGRPLQLLTDGRLCINASVSASIAGFTPNGNYTTLTATAASSASTALPVGTDIAFQNLSSIDLSCVLTAGISTATTNKIIVRAGATVFLTIGSATTAACINQTGSASNVVALMGGSGLGSNFGGASAGGGGGATTIADGADATQGLIADAVVTAGASGTQSAKLRAISRDIGTIATNSALPLPTQAATVSIGGVGIIAGETHVGEISSNQIKVQVAQTVTSASAYTSGNAVGGLMTIAGAARVSGSAGAAGTGGILTGLTMNSKSLQTTQVDIFLFDANPTGSTCTDKTAFVLATADFDKVVGMLSIPGAAANGAGWFGGGTGSAGVPMYYPVTYDLASATSIYACAVTRGTPTYTATTDVSFKFNMLRN